MLLTAEDIYNETGINLEQKLNMQPQFVSKWLARQERLIESYIANCAYGGMAQVNYYLTDDTLTGYIKEAIIEQVRYLDKNNYVDSSEIANSEEAGKYYHIAPLARDILENNGLLYTGAWRL